MRRLVVAGAALAAAVSGALAVVGAPADAVPIDTNWVAGGTGAVTDSAGAGSAASMHYNADDTGSNTWTFTATATQAATPDDPIKVPWSWVGLHAWYQVTTNLDMLVGGAVIPGNPPLVADGPVDCCTSPSNGFAYGGVATFTDVGVGETYGFRLSGSNFDSNNLLRGTFTLSTRPYIDATLAGDNRDWPGAVDLATAPNEKRTITEAGEARWFKFPVVPNQDVSVTLTSTTRDYDIALYGDIQTAYNQLTGDTDQLAASSDGVPLSANQVPDYPTQATTIPDKENPPTTATFAPRIYAPRIYAPRIYAPRIYAPRIYAPRIYAPNAYDPGLAADPQFQQAFSAAQNQTLLAVSAKTGTGTQEAVLDKVGASSGNTDGFFYVRVQGHTDQLFDKTNPFTLSLVSGGSGCQTELSTFPDSRLMPTPDPDAPANPAAVIVTDSGRIKYPDDVNGAHGTPATLIADLDELADATNGVVVDLADSPRVQDLWDQIDPDNRSCPYAVNLVAAAVDEIVQSFRNPESRYVVLAGGDDVVPFFRYPDVSGLGQEKLFDPPMSPGSPADASLKQDQVLGQDAYGSDTDVTIGGATLPLPDLAVGRLVKNDVEIGSTIDNFLHGGGNLLTPSSSLVTGYDFLADSAKGVDAEFASALGTGAPAGAADTLISDPTDPQSIPPWTATQLRTKLLGDTHHDLVFLAGHFSANDTLAADFTSTLNADELGLPANANKLANTLILSAGCHSGYSIVDDQAIPNDTETEDWTQRLARQHAILIGGTGYQYGDSDFLEYSERLYLEIARRLHEGRGDDTDQPVAVGTALAKAKQDYLAGITTMTGIDQKALLQATLYGLPMTGVDAPGRTQIGSGGERVDPGNVVTAEPGKTLGLRTIDKSYVTPTEAKPKPSGLPAPHDTLTWLEGEDGVSVQPGVPALPKQVEDVTPTNGLVLRGVGFRGGSYTDDTGILPLTGAPAIEAPTPNSTFESDSFFPQRLTTVNYFGALAGNGRTSLILTPGQYRTDQNPDPALPTDTQRTYSNMDVRLFYSDDTSTSFGGSQPAQAAPPAISDVQGFVAGNQVTFSVRATGDPAAGVQQVWILWTGSGSDSGHGTWAPVDLTLDPVDSTRWIGTTTIPSTQSPGGFRFIVQAANGVGAVSLDVGTGDGYELLPAGSVPASVFLRTHEVTSGSPLGVTAGVVDVNGAPVSGRAVHYEVWRNGSKLYERNGTSTLDGSVEILLPDGQSTPPIGELEIRVQLVGTTSTDTVFVTVADDAPVTISATSPAFLTARAGQPYPTGTPLTATVRDAYGPVAGYPVTFSFPTGTGVPTAVFIGDGDARPSSWPTTTGSNGVATARPAIAGPVVGTFVATITAGDATATVPMAAQYGLATFASPVTESKVNNLSTSTMPLKTTALLANGSALSDGAAAALVQSGQLQLRWRELTPTTSTWRTKLGLVTYNADKDLFQADIKSTTIDGIKGRKYQIEMRILPTPVSTLPAATAAAQSDFDLGGRSITVLIK